MDRSPPSPSSIRSKDSEGSPHSDQNSQDQQQQVPANPNAPFNAALLEMANILRNSVDQLNTLVQRLGTNSPENFNINEARQPGLSSGSLFTRNPSIIQFSSFPIPLFPANAQKQVRIVEWLGRFTPILFENCVHLLAEGLCDERNAKIYCSEMFLYAVQGMIKINEPNLNELMYLNEVNLNEILNYRLTQYEGKASVFKNHIINDLVERDNLEDPDNDFVFRSGVKFALKRDGQNYNRQIMQLLNYIIRLMEDRGHYAQAPKQVIKDLFISPVREAERLPLVERFEEDMRAIYSAKDKDVKGRTIRKQQKGLSFTFPLIQYSDQAQRKAKNLDKEQGMTEAAEESQNADFGSHIRTIPLFTEEQIASGEINLSNMALIQLVQHWILELEAYFEQDYVMERQYPFRMKSGQCGYLRSAEFNGLSKVIHYLNNSADGPQQTWKKIKLRHYQSLIASALKSPNIPSDMQNQNKKRLKELAIADQLSHSRYLIEYLNCLIHNLLKASEIYYCGYLQNGFKTKLNKEGFQELCKIVKNRRQENRRGYGSQREADEKTPVLISLIYRDLLQAKFSLRDSDANAVHNLFQKLYDENSQFLSIVSSQNRLQKSQRDLLIDIRYRKAMLARIRIVPKINKLPNARWIRAAAIMSAFMKDSLKGKFGPYTQMSIILLKEQPELKLKESVGKKQQ